MSHRETCAQCTRSASRLTVEGKPNFVQTKKYGIICTPCARALEVSGVEVPGYEPTPRRHQRRATQRTTKKRRVRR